MTRKKIVRLAIMSHCGVMTLHMIADIVGLSHLLDSPRAIIWLSLFGWSLAMNFGMLWLLLTEGDIVKSP